MQCSRCNSNSREIKWTRTRFNRAKLKYQANLHHLAPANPSGTIDDSWTAQNEDADLTPGTFIQTYKSVLFICAITAVFCASALFYLGYDVLYLGVFAVPFLAIFTAGLALSIGLPFKMRKEHAVITRSYSNS